MIKQVDQLLLSGLHGCSLADRWQVVVSMASSNRNLCVWNNAGTKGAPHAATNHQGEVRLYVFLMCCVNKGSGLLSRGARSYLYACWLLQMRAGPPGTRRGQGRPLCRPDTT